MREVKYRAWDKGSEEMHFDWGIDSSLGSALWHRMFGGVSEIKAMKNGYDLPKSYDHFEDYVFMQYTGLKDSEGTEIYEGDILSYENRISSEKILVVEWSQWDAMVNFGGIRVDYATRNGTVIGNIYDNPELLEENK